MKNTNKTKFLAMVMAIVMALSVVTPVSVMLASAADQQFAEDRSRATEGFAYMGNTLNVGESLNVGEFLMSPNGHFIVAMQPNGNAVKYRSNWVLWHTARWHSEGNGGVKLTVESNRIVLYDVRWDGIHVERWSSGIINAQIATLTIQDNGKFVARDINGNPVWIDDDVVHELAEAFPAPQRIALSQNSRMTFSTTIFGAVRPGAQSVSVINTGNVHSGPLTIALSGTHASSFTLANIAFANTGLDIGVSREFTVRPQAGLSVGTHNATVTVSGANGILESFDVRYTVSASPDIYEIDLSQSGLLTFDPANIGYTTPTATTITVTNTGSVATGTLSIVLLGTNANAFVLSRTTLTSITAGSNRTFTVRPATGLEQGTYNATVTVSGSNGISESFNMRFVVSVPASISITPATTHTFPSATVGYDQQATQSFGVQRTAPVATGTMTVSLSGTNANAFTLSTTSLTSLSATSNLTRTFTVRPNNGLAQGVYTATITVNTANGASESVDLSFTVSAPIMHSIFLQIDSFNNLNSLFHATHISGGRYEFASRQVGYAQPDAAGVRIRNGGSATADRWTAELSGSSPEAFTLSTISVAMIGSVNIPVFTVRPVAGLAQGEYEAIVTVSGDDIVSSSFRVRFAVTATTSTTTPPTTTTPEPTTTPPVTTTPESTTSSPTTTTQPTEPPVTTTTGTTTPEQTTPTEPPPVYEVSINQPAELVFDSVDVGYNTFEAEPITVSNTGSIATRTLTIELSGSGANAFILSRTSLASIAIDGTREFTIRPRSGLAEGVYTATVTISNSNITESFDVRFVVTAPPIPEPPNFIRGHILSNDKAIGIGDALEILKYLAGINSVIVNCDRAWNAALITNCRQPTISCALEILKRLAGIRSMLDNPERPRVCRTSCQNCR